MSNIEPGINDRQWLIGDITRNPKRPLKKGTAPLFCFLPVMNKMQLAIKHNSTVDREGLLPKIVKIKDFYGRLEHCLETLLNEQ